MRSPTEILEDPLSHGTRVICRTTGMLLVAWFLFGLFTRLVGREFYPSLSMPAFVKPRTFDFENLETVEHTIVYFRGDLPVRALSPRELFDVYGVEALHGLFQRTFPMSEGFRSETPEREFWDWMCKTANVDADQVDEIRINELRRRVIVRAELHARPGRNSICLLSPLRKRDRP